MAQNTPSSAEAMVEVGRLRVNLEGSVSFNIGTKQSIISVSDFHSPWQSPDIFKAAGVHFRVSLTRAAAAQFKCTLLILTEEQKAAYLRLASSNAESLTRTALLKQSKEVTTNVELYSVTLDSSYCQNILFENSSSLFKPEPLKLPLFFHCVLSVSPYSCPGLYQCQARFKALFRSVPLSAPPAFLARLLGGLLSDVTLRVQQKELRAHRCVLAAVSDVFRAMLEDARFKESATGVVNVKDVRAEVMEAALRHCYGQELGVLDGSTLSELLILSERYQLMELKALCEELLATDQSLDALQLLALADTLNAESLKRAVMLRIVKSPNRKSIISQASALKVVRSNPEALVDLMMKMA